VPPFDCELVLRENGDETRQPHSSVEEIRPGTAVHFDRRDWIVVEILEPEGALPEVICRPRAERV
jgi:hypothetical protein